MGRGQFQLMDKRGWLPKAVLADGLIVTLLVSVIFATTLKNRLHHKFGADVGGMQLGRG